MSQGIRRGEDTTMGEPGFCGKCGIHVPDGPDACLGVIPGVSHACCGHGDPTHAYVVFGGRPDQSVEEFESLVLRGQDAVDFFAAMARSRAAEGTVKYGGKPA